MFHNVLFVLHDVLVAIPGTPYLIKNKSTASGADQPRTVRFAVASR